VLTYFTGANDNTWGDEHYRPHFNCKCHTRTSYPSAPASSLTPWSESASELYRPGDRRQLVRIEGATWSAWRFPPAAFSIF
jgi:hypothetical protein